MLDLTSISPDLSSEYIHRMLCLMVDCLVAYPSIGYLHLLPLLVEVWFGCHAAVQLVLFKLAFARELNNTFFVVNSQTTCVNSLFFAHLDHLG